MGDRIRTLRSSRRMSQESLAEILGVTGSAVSQWEGGNTKNIKTETFLKICEFFSCDPFWLGLGDSHAPDRPSPNSRQGMVRG